MKKKGATREENLKYLGTIGRIAAIFFIGFSLLLLVSTIILIIMTKPEREVVVPDVEGKRFVEVYNSLVRKGIKPEIKFKDIADLDDGMVLSQYPKKGKVVPENSHAQAGGQQVELFHRGPEPGRQGAAAGAEQSQKNTPP